MPSCALRRPSDLAHELIRVFVGKLTGKKDSLKAEDSRRSRSTGDLDQADYMLIDYSTTKASTSSDDLPAHFDDCDRVPMKFDSNGAHLLKQTISTQRFMRRGSKECGVPVTASQLHLAQLWFYPELSRGKAESILVRTGLVDGSFLIRTYEGRTIVSLAHKGKISHLLISCCFVKGELKYRIDIDKAFSNLCELVEHYRKHKGFVLPYKLKTGVARGIRVEKRAEVIISSKKNSI